MRQPAATFRDGAIYWRGSDATFSYMHEDTAKRLLPTLIEERWRAPDHYDPLIADLAKAIRQYDHQQEAAHAA